MSCNCPYYLQISINDPTNPCVGNTYQLANVVDNHWQVKDPDSCTRQIDFYQEGYPGGAGGFVTYQSTPAAGGVLINYDTVDGSSTCQLLQFNSTSSTNNVQIQGCGNCGCNINVNVAFVEDPAGPFDCLNSANYYLPQVAYNHWQLNIPFGDPCFGVEVDFHYDAFYGGIVTWTNGESGPTYQYPCICPSTITVTFSGTTANNPCLPGSPGPYTLNRVDQFTWSVATPSACADSITFASDMFFSGTVTLVASAGSGGGTYTYNVPVSMNQCSPVVLAQTGLPGEVATVVTGCTGTYGSCSPINIYGTQYGDGFTPYAIVTLCSGSGPDYAALAGSVSPPFAGPGDTVRVCGSNITCVTGVSVGGIAATYTFSGHCVIITIPPTATSGPIVINTCMGNILIPYTIASPYAPQVTQITLL